MTKKKNVQFFFYIWLPLVEPVQNLPLHFRTYLLNLLNKTRRFVLGRSRRKRNSQSRSCSSGRVCSSQSKCVFHFIFSFDAIAYVTARQVSPTTPSRSFLFSIGYGRKLISEDRLVLEIFTKRSFPHLRATFKMFESLTKKDIMSMIEKVQTYEYKYSLQTIGTYNKHGISYSTTCLRTLLLQH